MKISTLLYMIRKSDIQLDGLPKVMEFLSFCLSRQKQEVTFAEFKEYLAMHYPSFQLPQRNPYEISDLDLFTSFLLNNTFVENQPPIQLPTFLLQSTAHEWVTHFRHAIASGDRLLIQKTWNSGNSVVWGYFCGELIYCQDGIFRISPQECYSNFVTVIVASETILKQMWREFTVSLVKHLLPASSNPLELDNQVHLLELLLTQRSSILPDFIGKIRNIAVLQNFLERIIDAPETKIIQMVQFQIKKNISENLAHGATEEKATERTSHKEEQKSEGNKSTSRPGATGKPWSQSKHPNMIDAKLWVADFKKALSNKDSAHIKAAWGRGNVTYWSYFIGNVTLFSNGSYKLEDIECLDNFEALLVAKQLRLINEMWRAKSHELITFIQKMSHLGQFQFLVKALASRVTTTPHFVQSISAPKVLTNFLQAMKEKNINDPALSKILLDRLQELTQPTKKSSVSDETNMVMPTQKKRPAIESTSQPKNKEIKFTASQPLTNTSSVSDETKTAQPAQEKRPAVESTPQQKNKEIKFTASQPQPLTNTSSVSDETKTAQPAQRKRPAVESTPPQIKKGKKFTASQSPRKTIMTIVPAEPLDTWIQYAEYKTNLIAITKKRRAKTETSQTAYRTNELLQLAKNPKLFQFDANTKSFNTWLTWTNGVNLIVNVKFTKTNQLQICFIASEKNKAKEVLIQIAINSEKNEVIVTTQDPKEPWHPSDLDDIVSDFYDFLPEATFHYTPFLPDFPGKKEKMNTDEFSEAITYYKNQNITTRLLKTFTSMPSGPSVFWLTWNSVDLRVTIESAPYKSYVFSPAAFSLRYYPNDNFVAKHHKIIISHGSNSILELLSTLDALVLEIYELNARNPIAGNEAIKILHKFLQLIQPKNYFLHDISYLTIQKPNSNVENDFLLLPLRIIKMLTVGKTWYEGHLPVSAISATLWQSSWHKKVVLSQSAHTFYKAATALRTISFESLLKIWSDDRDWLLAIANKYYPDQAHEKLCGRDIFAVIFDKTNMSTPEGYADLEKVYALLGIQAILDEIEKNNNPTNPVHMTNEIQESIEIKDASDVRLLCREIGYTRFFEHRTAVPEEKTNALTTAQQKRQKMMTI